MKKKKNSLKTIDIIIIILIACVVMFLIYNSTKKQEPKNETNNNEMIPEKTDNDKWINIAAFPENDSSVEEVILSYDGVECDNNDLVCSEIDLLKNNNLNFKLKNFSIKFKCLDYFSDKEDDLNYCVKNQIIIDNKVKYEFENQLEFDDTETLIFKTKKYYVIKNANTVYGQGDLKIYNLDGKLIKSINNTVTEFDDIPDSDEDEMIPYKFNPTINNNKLYYVYSDYLNFENGLDNIVHLGYVDLNNNFKYTELYSQKGMVSLGI